MTEPTEDAISRREFLKRSVLTAAAITAGGMILAAPKPVRAAGKPPKLRHYAALLIKEKQNFLNPRGLAFASDGSLFVCDSGHYQIRKFNPDGAEALGNFPLGVNLFDPPLDREISDDALLNFPEAVAVAPEPDGRIYVASTCAGEIAVFNADGSRRGTIGVLGPQDGQLYMPSSLALRDGRVLVADSRNARIQAFDSEGAFKTAYWRVEVGGKPPEKTGENPGYEKKYENLFRLASGVAVSARGRIIASDEQKNEVYIIDVSGDQIRAKPIKWNGFKKPLGVAADAAGNIYVCNSGRAEVLVFSADGKYIRRIGRFRFAGEEERFVEPVAAAIEPETQSLFVADAKLGRIIPLFPEQVDPREVERELKEDEKRGK